MKKTTNVNPQLGVVTAGTPISHNHPITHKQAIELLEFMESVGYDLDTPFELFTNEKVTSGNPSITKTKENESAH